MSTGYEKPPREPLSTVMQVLRDAGLTPTLTPDRIREQLAHLDRGDGMTLTDAEQRALCNMALAASRDDAQPSTDCGNPPCGQCGGPHPFDTVVPSAVWNRVVRAQGISEYLCLTCIVRAFVAADTSFTAQLIGSAIAETSIEVCINGKNALDALIVSDENTALRARINELERGDASMADKPAETERLYWREIAATTEAQNMELRRELQADKRDAERYRGIFESGWFQLAQWSDAESAKEGSGFQTSLPTKDEADAAIDAAMSAEKAVQQPKGEER